MAEKFVRLRKKLQVLKSINENQLLNRIIARPEISQLIVELNTNSQLFAKGINSVGVRLDTIGGSYTRATIEGTSEFAGKKELGLPFDRITLFNTGEYHDSFRVEIPTNAFADFFTIKSDHVKDGTDLFDRWGAEVEGLTPESLEFLRGIIRPILSDIIRQGLNAA